MRTWSVQSAFKEYMNDLEYLDEEIQDWVDTHGGSHEHAYKVIEDAEWETWDSVADFDSWLDDITWGMDIDMDTLQAQAQELLNEDIFGVIGFDEDTKTLVRCERTN